MGQQYNKKIKRRRRKAYVARKKALVKAGIRRKVRATAKADVAKKKAPAKKAAPKKPKSVKKAEETVENTTTAVLETSSPETTVESTPAAE
jgi:hypothetical protein